MVLLLVAVMVIAGILVVLGRTITGDGYGLRPPPRSHRDEIDDVWSADDPRSIGRRVDFP